MQSPGTRFCDVELRRLPVSGHTAAAVRPWRAAPPTSEPARGPGFPVRVAGYTPTMSLVKSPVWVPVWASSNCRKAAGGLRRQPAAAARVPRPRSGRAPPAAPAPGLPDGAWARGGPALSPWPPQRRRLAPGGRVPWLVSCGLPGRSFCAALAHFAPTVLAPWTPLGSDRTSPPEGRGLWLGPPGQASLAGRRRPSPPARLGPGGLSRRRAAGRWFGASRGSPSRHAPRLSPRSASSQLRVRSDRPARRWGNRGPWEPHVRGVRSAPDSLWEGHSAPSARPRAPARWWSALSRAFSPDGAGDGEGL